MKLFGWELVRTDEINKRVEDAARSAEAWMLVSTGWTPWRSTSPPRNVTVWMMRPGWNKARQVLPEKMDPLTNVWGLYWKEKM